MLGASSDVRMSAWLPPVPAVPGAVAEGPPCLTDDDELVPPPCWTSHSDSRGEKSQTLELLDSWLLRLRLL